jgi:HrpA-like RNA helicase
MILVPGRRYDVDILYTVEPEPDYIQAVIKTCTQIHMTPLSGDILVFLTVHNY